MSSPRPSTPATPAATLTDFAAHESFAVDLATTKANVKGLGEDLHGLDSRVGSMETEMRRGFTTITEQMGRVSSQFTEQLNRLSQPKGVAWPMVSVFTVLVLAMASWANTYFGQGISAAIKETQVVTEKWNGLNERLEKVAAGVVENKVDHARESAAAEVEAKYQARDLERIRVELDRVKESGKTHGP